MDGIPSVDAVNDVEGSAQWSAVILAGERPGGDPLAAQMNVPMKALIRINGLSLLDHVVSALLKSRRVGKIIVLAQDTATLARAQDSGIFEIDRVSLVQGGNGISSGIEAVAGSPLAPWPVLVTTADNALLTAERVDMFLDNVTDADLAAGVGERRIVESAFPDTKRTWLKFSDGHYSGANLFALANPACTGALRRWSEIEQDRKKGLKLMSSFGFGLLLRALTGRISFREGLAAAGNRLGCVAIPVVLDAEAPIDVDKLADIDIVERILAMRAGAFQTAQAMADLCAMLAS